MERLHRFPLQQNIYSIQCGLVKRHSAARRLGGLRVATALPTPGEPQACNGSRRKASIGRTPADFDGRSIHPSGLAGGHFDLA
ncbi:MAG: hypothetical protein U1E40_06505 [Amaricoccus sp.]